MNCTPEEIMNKLGELSASEIARLFRDEGITGRIRMDDACPVARYVERETGTPVSVDRGRWGPAHSGVRRHLPPTVNEFAVRFDILQYPYLIGAA